MKNIRIISIVLVFAFCFASFATQAFAFNTAADEVDESGLINSFSDNFDDYESDWSKTGNSVELGGGWISKPEESGPMGLDNADVFGFSDSKLKIGTYTKTHESFISDIMKNEAGVIHSIPVEISENQSIRVSGSKSHESDIWGIKFLVHNSGKNYYVFLVSGKYTRGDKSYFSNYGIYKFDDGLKTVIYEQAGTGQQPNAQGGFASSGGTTTLEVSYNNGEISYNFVHKIGSDTRIVYNGSVKDTSPFELENEELSVELFAAGSTNKTRSVLFDDFSVKESVPYITTGEPVNVLYAETTQAAYTDDDGIIDMQEENIIRIIESDASAERSFDLYLSNDKTVWEKISNCRFDEKGRWLNTKTGRAFRYMALSYDEVPYDLKVYTNVSADETYTVVLGKEYILKAKFGGITDNSLFEWTLSQDSATIENGILNPIRRGELNVVASYEGTELPVNINIIGPLDMAVKNDTVEAYINNNAEIINKINDGIKNDDNEKIIEVLQNNGEHKIEDIVDIDSKKITDLDEDELNKYIERIKTYGVFPFETSEDAYNLINTFENEYYVGLVCNVSDSDALKETLEERNAFYDLNLGNKYFNKYNDDVLNRLINCDYKNVHDLRDNFVNAYVLEAFDKALSVEMAESVLNDCADEIGYDKKHFSDNKCDDMYILLLNIKKDIRTLDDLKKIIDEYVKPKENQSGSSGSSGSSGGGGGGGGGSRSSSGSEKNKISISSDLVESINQQTIPEKIEIKNDEPDEKTIEYGDLNDSHWAYESIMFLSGLNIVSGSPDGNFRPDDSITRAEFLKILMLAFKDDLSEDADEHSFDDVKKDDWYYEYINQAYSAGIVLGDGKGQIRPNEKITREEMAVLIYRTLEIVKNKPENNNSVKIKDIDEISDWAKKEVSALYGKGILKGNDLGNFAPKNNTTRAETCAVIERLLK